MSTRKKVRRQGGRTHYSLFFFFFFALEDISPVVIHSSQFFSHSLSFQDSFTLLPHLSLYSFHNKKTVMPDTTTVDTNPQPTVIIVGAGLGGLMLAALLERVDIPYLILERATSFKPLGNPPSPPPPSPPPTLLLSYSPSLPLPLWDSTLAI